MSRTVLIIGNGFDLYHKLPTKYMDFLFFAEHWGKFKELYDSVDHTGAVRDRQINVRLGSKNELTEESIVDFANADCLYDPEHIKYLDENIRTNAWISYFHGRKPKGQGWIDFETEISIALHQVEKYYTELLPEIVDGVPFYQMSELMTKVVTAFSEKVEEPYQKLYSMGLEKTDVDPELLRPNKMALLRAMKVQLDCLNKCLNYYLEEFVSPIKCNCYSEQIRALEDIYLLNFNYTYTFAAVYGKRFLIQHHPVHGELKEENLVLGISDEDFPGSTDYIYFQKYFQRIQKRTGNYYQAWVTNPKFSALEDEKTKVFVMGHSLNKVDRGILQNFFLNQDVGKLTIFFHNQEGYEQNVINLVDMFGKDYVIDQTGKERIVFQRLEPAVEGDPRRM